jgi:hypothetical protein
MGPPLVFGLQRHEGRPKEKDDQGNCGAYGQGEIKIDHVSQRLIGPNVQEPGRGFTCLSLARR